MIERVAHDAVAERVCYVIGTLSLLAAALVVIAAVGYTGTWVAYFFPFVLVAIGQLIYGLVFLLRPWREAEWRHPRVARAWSGGLAVAGILANAALLGMLVYTRRYGLPFGPLAGRSLPFGPLGLIDLATEIGLLVSLALYKGRDGLPAAGAAVDFPAS